MVNLKSKLKQAQKQRGALLVMNLVIIALCLILFWGTIHMFRQLNDAFSRPAKTNWMENKVQNENYAYLLVNYHEDMVYGGLLSGTKKEAVGRTDVWLTQEDSADLQGRCTQTGELQDHPDHPIRRGNGRDTDLHRKKTAGFSWHSGSRRVHLYNDYKCLRYCTCGLFPDFCG